METKKRKATANDPYTERLLNKGLSLKRIKKLSKKKGRK